MREWTTEEWKAACEEVAQEAQAAGLKVAGLLASDLGWRPGVLLWDRFDSKAAVAFAEEHGYSCAPSNTKRCMAIIESDKPR